MASDAAPHVPVAGPPVAPDPAALPACPWPACPRCHGNPRPRWAGKEFDEDVGRVVWYGEIVCLQCTHTLANCNTLADSPAWAECWDDAPVASALLDATVFHPSAGARLPHARRPAAA